MDEMLDQAAGYCGKKLELILTNLMMLKTDRIALLEKIKGSPDVPAVMVAAVRDIPVGVYDSLLEPSGQLPAMARRTLDSRQVKIENRNYPMNLESLVATRSDPLRPAMQAWQRSIDVTLKTLGNLLGL